MKIYFIGIIVLLAFFVCLFSEICSCDENSTLFSMIESGNTQCFEKLLILGADPNSINYSGDTPITFALNNRPKQAKFIEILLRYGANPNLVPVGKDPPLIIAVQWADEKSVTLLLKSGAKKESRGIDGKNVLNSVGSSGPKSDRIKNLFR